MTDSPGHCGCCGRALAKAHRVHLGVRYCATCYARHFRRQQCPSCGQVARLFRHDPKATCRTCEVRRPCVRCQRAPGYPIALISPYGPVCGSCAPYFRTPKACKRCGRLSSRLSRALCLRCRQTDHGCCSACRRHRRLQAAPDGRMLCQRCRDLGLIRCRHENSASPDAKTTPGRSVFVARRG